MGIFTSNKASVCSVQDQMLLTYSQFKINQVTVLFSTIPSFQVNFTGVGMSLV